MKRLQYYGTKLSENISRRDPEGYLLCLNVPVARTGFQEYLPEELGLTGPGTVQVYRPAEEVFAPEALASFEGMPVTDGHPPDGVDVRNARRLQMGHAHHIRRGAGGESDLLLADLIITDPRLIGEILGGKREISCGYHYELREENGRYVQRRIRGNHIAVVDAGRAGHRVCIKDHQTTERRKNMNKSLSKILVRLARDGEEETLAEIIGALAENPEAPAAPESAPEAAPENGNGPEEAVTVEVPENREITIGGDMAAGLLERLDRLLALLEAGAAPAAPAADEPVEEAEEAAKAVEEILEAAAETEEKAGGPVTEEELAEMAEAIAESGASETLEEKEEDCGDPDPDAARDALRAALATFRPVLKRMTPRERRRACADIAAGMRAARAARGSDTYAALAAGRKAPAGNGADLGRRIMAARNVNYKEK